MTTNKNITTSFSLSRVGRLLRLSWAINRKTLFIGIGLQIFLIWFLPRVGMVLGQESYESWVKNFDSEAYIGMSLVGSSLLALLSWFILLNRQTRHHVPGAYTLLPASIGEKYLALLIQGVIILIIALGVAFGLITLTSIEIPNLWDELKGLQIHKILYQEYHFYNWDTYEVIATRPSFPFLGPLAGVLCYALASIHFRKVLLALFVTSISLFVVLPTILININFFGRLGSMIPNSPLYFSIGQYFLMTLCGLLFTAFYYRLKKLQIK